MSTKKSKGTNNDGARTWSQGAKVFKKKYETPNKHSFSINKL